MKMFDVRNYPCRISDSAVRRHMTLHMHGFRQTPFISTTAGRVLEVDNVTGKTSRKQIIVCSDANNPMVILQLAPSCADAGYTVDGKKHIATTKDRHKCIKEMSTESLLCRQCQECDEFQKNL